MEEFQGGEIEGSQNSSRNGLVKLFGKNIVIAGRWSVGACFSPAFSGERVKVWCKRLIMVKLCCVLF